MKRMALGMMCASALACGGPVVADDQEPAKRFESLDKNSDGTLHNVHTYVDKKTLFNKAQPPRAEAIEAKVDAEGVIRFQCDVHPWMTGYVVVSDNGRFDTTGEDGRFTVEGVPPGTYTVEAWHEKLGTQTAQVTVEPGETAKATFTFGAK